jgi:hypothetical protein
MIAMAGHCGRTVPSPAGRAPEGGMRRGVVTDSPELRIIG